MVLNTEEKLSLYGGGAFNIFAGFCAAVAFIISAIDGFLNTDGCKE